MLEISIFKFIVFLSIVGLILLVVLVFKKRKNIFKIIMSLFVIINIMFYIDFYRVLNKSEFPIFTICTEKTNDTGSGTYQGLFYRFDISGSALTNRINHVEYYILSEKIGQYMN